MLHNDERFATSGAECRAVTGFNVHVFTDTLVVRGHCSVTRMLVLLVTPQGFSALSPEAVVEFMCCFSHWRTDRIVATHRLVGLAKHQEQSQGSLYQEQHNK